jgi:hypothetical protein
VDQAAWGGGGVITHTLYMGTALVAGPALFGLISGLAHRMGETYRFLGTTAPRPYRDYDSKLFSPLCRNGR